MYVAQSVSPGTIGLVAVTFLVLGGYWWLGLVAAWVPLGLLAAVSLTSSPGPARGRELMGRRLPVVVATMVIVTWAVGSVSWRFAGRACGPGVVPR